MDNRDYSAAANVWQRVNPTENPYPDAAPPMRAAMPAPMPSVPQNRDGMCRALLQEEVRHLRQMLTVLEMTLAQQ